MSLRSWIKRLEHGARDGLGSFVLEDGSRHYFDPTSGEIFLHGCACIRAGADGEPFPDPPETIRALCQARDRAAAVEQVAGASSIFPYGKQTLVERGVLVPASWIGPVRDMSEP